MGRVKIQMRKIENRQQRNIAFSKRKSRILKKAFELYTLCHVQIAVILFSPSGKLFLFDAKTRIEETINKYVDLPGYKRGRLQDEPFIRRWIDGMRLESKYGESNLSGNINHGILRYQLQDIEDEFQKCKNQIANVEQQLGRFLKNPNHWTSIAEVDEQEKLLQKTLDHVRHRKQYLEVESKPFDVPNWTDIEISPVE